jgi:dihydroflavonol-4-reductase
MKIMVTGATGFMGSCVLRRLLAEGMPCAVLVRPASKLTNIDDLRDRVEVRHGDVTDAASLRSALHGITHVYHCAGLPRIGPSYAELLHQVNVAGTRNMLRAARENGVERFLYTSSVTAIGITGTKQPATEEQPWNLGGLQVTYFTTKHLAEQEVARAVGEGLDCVIANPGYAFGPGDINFNSGRIIRDLYRRKVPFYPLGGISVIDVGVAVDGIVAVMEKGRTGERYILGGENIAYKDFFDLVCGIVGVPKIRVPILPILVKLVVKLAENSHRPRNITPLVNREILMASTKHLYYDPAKARRELGLGERPIAASLREAFAWYRAAGII